MYFCCCCVTGTGGLGVLRSEIRKACINGFDVLYAEFMSNFYKVPVRSKTLNDVISQN